MTPEMILASIRAVADAIAETMRYLQTPQGQAAVERALRDREAWDRFWESVGDGIRELFSGRLFRPGGQ